MRGWIILIVTLLIGVGAGVVGTVVLPPYITQYAPSVLHPPMHHVEGRVIRKAREQARVLLKVQTNAGVLLLSFTEKVAEVDLLVDQDDLISLSLRANPRPFIDNPSIERVQPAPAPTPGGPAAAGSSSPSR